MAEKIVITVKGDDFDPRPLALFYTPLHNGDLALALGKKGLGDQSDSGLYDLGRWGPGFGSPLEIARAFRAAFQELETQLARTSTSTTQSTGSVARPSPSL